MESVSRHHALTFKIPLLVTLALHLCSPKTLILAWSPKVVGRRIVASKSMVSSPVYVKKNDAIVDERDGGVAAPSIVATSYYTSQMINPASKEQNCMGATRRAVFRSSVRSISLLVAAVALWQSCEPPCKAISAEEASKAYDKYASSYDDLDGGSAASVLGIDEARARLLRSAYGRVLEIGVGTGLNIENYQFTSQDDDIMQSKGPVTSLTFVDISEGMLRQAKAKFDSFAVPSNVEVEFIKADATSQLVSLFGRDSFDTVVDTFSLCVMGNDGAKACLAEMAQVVKSGKDRGKYVYCLEPLVTFLPWKSFDNSLLLT